MQAGAGQERSSLFKPMGLLWTCFYRFFKLSTSIRASFHRQGLHSLAAPQCTPVSCNSTIRLTNQFHQGTGEIHAVDKGGHDPRTSTILSLLPASDKFSAPASLQLQTRLHVFEGLRKAAEFSFSVVQLDSTFASVAARYCITDLDTGALKVLSPILSSLLASRRVRCVGPML